MISWPASVSAHQLTAAGTLVIADPKDFEKTSAQSERTLLNKLKSNKSKLVVGKPCARCIAVSFSDIGVKVWSLKFSSPTRYTRTLPSPFKNGIFPDPQAHQEDYQTYTQSETMLRATHIHHSHAPEYDLDASTTSIRSVYRPKLERAGSDASEISEYMKDKIKDVLEDSEKNEWIVIPSYEKGIRESYILPMDNDKIDHFLLRLEEALTSDETPLMGMQPAFIFLRPGCRRTSAGVDIILAKDCTLARSPECLYLSFKSAPVADLASAVKSGGLFRSWIV